jgi:hypothetical protein
MSLWLSQNNEKYLSLEPKLKLDKFPDDCRFPENLLSF